MLTAGAASPCPSLGEGPVAQRWTFRRRPGGAAAARHWSLARRLLGRVHSSPSNYRGICSSWLVLTRLRDAGLSSDVVGGLTGDRCAANSGSGRRLVVAGASRWRGGDGVIAAQAEPIELGRIASGMDRNS